MTETENSGGSARSMVVTEEVGVIEELDAEDVQRYLYLDLYRLKLKLKTGITTSRTAYP